MENLIDFWRGKNLEDNTEVMKADKKNSSRGEEISSAVPGNISVAEKRNNQASHQTPKSPGELSSKGVKKILIEEPATRYNIGGTAELGKFRDVVEFCHPLGPEIIKDRRFFVRIEVSGIPAIALVDSGASRTYVIPRFVDRFGDRVFETPDARTINELTGHSREFQGKLEFRLAFVVRVTKLPFVS